MNASKKHLTIEDQTIEPILQQMESSGQHRKELVYEPELKEKIRKLKE